MGVNARGQEEEAPAAPAEPDVAQIEVELEQKMEELGELSSDSREESDIVRADCVRQKYARAQETMELATTELLIIRDSSTSAQARAFAIEKLEAANERLGGMVDGAKACQGVLVPQENENVTKNDKDEQNPVPNVDPSKPPLKPDGTPPEGLDTTQMVVPSPTM